MKAARYSDSQIMAILKQAEAGSTVPDLCREHGMSSASFYKWRAKFGGMDVSMMTRMKELEDENKRLKKMYIEAQMQADIIKEAMSEIIRNISASRDGSLGR
ncbi:putative transposase [Iodobacter fluviatilis]|uniref:Transposase n=1 Tax=Iodobacter fluviatilis TaxID=537 RepID=A0A377Q5L1_9NEIS|nr:transposase [Iodobacter fluviatilis]TCU84646.1 putative transposase [Iodobacter fluviatilis]STQ90112.1 Transposase [Iodobacter fluviatilis]